MYFIIKIFFNHIHKYDSGEDLVSEQEDEMEEAGEPDERRGGRTQDWKRQKIIIMRLFQTTTLHQLIPPPRLL